MLSEHNITMLLAGNRDKATHSQQCHFSACVIHTVLFCTLLIRKQERKNIFIYKRAPI